MIASSNKPTVSLINAGLIDPLVISTMGVNVKPGGNAIGYFGTGLKYAIAVLLRTGHQVTVWRGEEELRFVCRQQAIRGKAFELIYMNEQPLGFTTELGKNWTVPMAFRELWSNMLDEHGRAVSNVAEPQPETTTITVVGSEFYNAYLARDMQFLSTKPLWENDILAIHKPIGAQNGAMFYRGVKVMSLQAESRYVYNIKAAMQLTEDRTLMYLWNANNKVGEGISQCTDEELLRVILLDSKEKSYEQDSHLVFMAPFSDAFLKVAEELGPRACIAARTALARYRGRTPMDDLARYELNAVDRKVFERGVAFAKAIGYDVLKYDVVFVDDLGHGVLAMAEQRKIWIGKGTFAGGVKSMAHSLIEEYLHLEYKVTDGSRELQNMLFEKIISLGEQLRGEPI